MEQGQSTIDFGGVSHLKVGSPGGLSLLDPPECEWMTSLV